MAGGLSRFTWVVGGGAEASTLSFHPVLSLGLAKRRQPPRSQPLLFQERGKSRALRRWEIEKAALGRAVMLIPVCLSLLINSQLKGYFLQEKVFEFRANGIVLNSAKRFL